MDQITQTKEERRQRRAERREKQRAANFSRAEKMHQLRSAADRERGKQEQLEMEALRADDNASVINIGCSGWYYWHWNGIFYPEQLPRSDWFSHYASSFRTVELNAPFYSWPTEQTVKTWIKQAGRRHFVYTVKVCELITHVKRFTGTKTLVRDFGYIGEMLGPKMGCFLFQLPPSFDYSASRLRSIVTQLDPRWRNVVEFRHRSWWNETVYSAFRDSGTIFCSTSGPRLPDELVRTANEIYVRFHGITKWYQHRYSRDELAEWARRIKECGAEKVWAYFNNDRDGNAIVNARTLRRLLAE